MVLSKEMIISNFGKVIASNKLARNMAAKQFEKILYKNMVEKDDPLFSWK